MLPARNTEGDDISHLVTDAAELHGLDPVHLLALLHAESGLNPRAERWGRETDNAKAAIEAGDWSWLQRIIDRTWPDISFGMSQRIVPYHSEGDRSRSVVNCLAVRDVVFGDPAGDIAAAGARLAACFQHWSCDGTVLSAMVVYNAGSDRRGNPAWLAEWAGNVESYARSLEWAEAYRGKVTESQPVEDSMPTIIDSMTLIWDRLDRIQKSAGGQTVEDITSLAEEAKQQGVVEMKKTIGLQ